MVLEPSPLSALPVPLAISKVDSVEDKAELLPHLNLRFLQPAGAISSTRGAASGRREEMNV